MLLLLFKCSFVSKHMFHTYLSSVSMTDFSYDEQHGEALTQHGEALTQLGEALIQHGEALQLTLLVNPRIIK